jgi:hypothetical protein
MTPAQSFFLSPMGGDATAEGASRLAGGHGLVAVPAASAFGVTASFRLRPSRSTGRRRVGARAFVGSATGSGLATITPRTESGCGRRRRSVVFPSRGSVRAGSRRTRRRALTASRAARRLRYGERSGSASARSRERARRKAAYMPDDQRSTPETSDGLPVATPKGVTSNEHRFAWP